MKILLFLTSIILIFSGWFLDNLFSGSNQEYLWNLVLNLNQDFFIKYDNQKYYNFNELAHIICLLGLLISMFNYVLIPKIGNNIKIKHNKIFKYYSSYLLSKN